MEEECLFGSPNTACNWHGSMIFPMTGVITITRLDWKGGAEGPYQSNIFCLGCEESLKSTHTEQLETLTGCLVA